MKSGRLYFTFVWSLVCFFSSAQPPQSRPNIILIIGDDMRYDSFEPNGGPAWFDSPAINRIADEGANFKDYFCVYSLCTPGRGAMLTGLYPHGNGAIDNSSPYYSYLPTIANILDSTGYHTAMIGKYHAYFKPQPGWDYWMARSKLGGSYMDLEFNINGESKIIEGHVTQIIGDSSVKIISTIDTPFLVMIGHQAPHQPALPLPEDSGIYGNEEMPVPSLAKYNKNYPSYLYEEAPLLTEENLAMSIQAYFECVKDIDGNIADIFNTLEERGILDNTILIFTADNGMMNGEHYLNGKGFPYEPSIRLPMFIRYPGWFAPNTVVDVPIGLNVDVAPTILDAAGIDQEPYHFHGLSLHKLATGELSRSRMMYENIKLADESGDSGKPSIRSIRSKYYKYNWYRCSEQTEEFFDLIKDPDESKNLILDPEYAALIVTYRHTLDSLRSALHDTLAADSVVKPCHLVKGREIKGMYVVDNPIPLLDLGTNPFIDRLIVNFMVASPEPVQINIYNALGQVLISNRLDDVEEGNLSIISFDTKNLPGGFYLVEVIQGVNRRCEYAIKE